MYGWTDVTENVCTYTITVNGGGGPPMLQRPMPRLTINGTPCACGTVDVCFPGYSDGCDPVFEWTVDGVPTGGPEDDCVEVMIPENVMPGDRIRVCLTATIGNPLVMGGACDQDFTCIDVIPIPPEQHIGTCRVVCFEDQPVFWQGIPITSSCINPPCSVRTDHSWSGLLCGFFKIIHITAASGSGN